ncbi:MAG: nucleotidyltransferase domain-containing protein [Desulfurococcaceae archaeon]
MQIPSNNRYNVLRRAYSNIEFREEMFRGFIDRVCRSRYIKEVYLVGSRAHGDHIPSSDFDIVVVVEAGDPVEIAEYISSLRAEPVPIDIIVLSEEDLEDPVYKEMLKGRKKLC